MNFGSDSDAYLKALYILIKIHRVSSNFLTQQHAMQVYFKAFWFLRIEGLKNKIDKIRAMHRSPVDRCPPVWAHLYWQCFMLRPYPPGTTADG